MWTPKRISIAVIGFPSSGKSYLISDLVTSLSQVGFIPKKLPLSFPYNSLGGFFNDVFVNGGMKQTGRIACRPTNHYGAYLEHQRSGRRIAIDFLNIPGETFRDSQKQLVRYGNLVKAIKRIKKGVFCVTTWKNPSGKVCYLLEPTSGIQKRLNIPLQQLEESNADISSLDYLAFREGDYLSWKAIFSELNHGSYNRVGNKQVSGEYLLDHFFDINSDSIFATLKDVWTVFALDMLKDEYVAERAFHDFYYMHYSVNATDLVICDKLFVKGKNPVADNQQNFLDMVDVLAGLFPYSKRAPHTYLAFRGTDLMMKHDAVKNRFADGDKETVRMLCYEEVVKQINTLIDNGCLDISDDDALIDPSPKGCTVTTGGDIVSHILSRVGGDAAHGFMKLLQVSSIKNTARTGTIPHHVFFTATPIDDKFRFYFNESGNATRFIYREKNNTTPAGINWFAFHIEIAEGRAQKMCFGTLQLLLNIMKNNNINIK